MSTQTENGESRSTLATGSTLKIEAERRRQREKWRNNKDRYSGRDVAEGYNYFWAKRGGVPR